MQKKWTLQKVSAYLLQEEAKKRWYTVDFFNEDKNLFFIKNKKKEILFKWIEWWLTSKLARYISVDKHLTHSLLLRNHINFPAYIVINKQEKIDFKAIMKLWYPLVTKPLDWSIGRWVVINIKNKEELKKALSYSAKFGNDIIVQKFIKGKNLRILVIDHKVFAWLEWIRHHITWDGKTTIRKLLEKENLNPRRGENILTSTLPKIIINKELADFFKAQYWYSFTHRLKKNEKIFLKGNWYSKVVDITDHIPKDIKKTCETVSKIFNLKFAGVDVIYDTSAKQNKYQILEINSQPWIKTHHLPMEWKPRNVAWAILDLYFGE
jgi:cyanophycin synthetase